MYVSMFYDLINLYYTKIPINNTFSLSLYFSTKDVHLVNKIHTSLKNPFIDLGFFIHCQLTTKHYYRFHSKLLITNQTL